MELSLGRRMPAEWERHEATWIAWPHHEPDWPGKLAPIPWVYAEIVRALGESERVEILCHDESVAENARRCSARTAVKERKLSAAPRVQRSSLAPGFRADRRDSRQRRGRAAQLGIQRLGEVPQL